MLLRKNERGIAAIARSAAMVTTTRTGWAFLLAATASAADGVYLPRPSDAVAALRAIRMRVESRGEEAVTLSIDERMLPSWRPTELELQAGSMADITKVPSDPGPQ